MTGNETGSHGPAPGLIMAFDFGLRRIGVAIGQAITGTATPVAILPAKQGTPDWTAVTALIDEWEPALFVVGLPLNMNGTDSEMSLLALRFARRLEGRYRIPFEMADERLSTFEARHQDPASRSPVDNVAARLILESWFREKA